MTKETKENVQIVSAIAMLIGGFLGSPDKPGGIKHIAL